MEPIYRSDGEWVAVYKKGHIFNCDKEWIGFVIGRDVYDPAGLYLGFLSNDRRLLRSRSRPTDRLRREPPPTPQKPKLPAYMPLAPLMQALPYHLIDMFEEFPDRLCYVSETRPDME